MKIIEWFKKLFNRIEARDKPLTAEEAYYKSKYGEYKTIEQLIKINQKNINELIKSKVSHVYSSYNRFGSFYCVVDLDDEMKPYVSDIFQPFIDNGFKVINLSEKIKEINDDLVFLISWYKKQ